MKNTIRPLNVRHGITLILSLIFSILTSWGQIIVQGTVVDEPQVPIPGANVVIKGENTTGTITDFDKIVLMISINNGSSSANAYGVDFYFKDIEFREYIPEEE